MATATNDHTSTTKPGPGLGWLSLFGLAIALTAMLTACGTRNYGYKPPTEVDVFERAPVGEKIDITDFKWKYLPNNRIQVTGTAKNNSGKALNGVTLFAMLFDEKGKAVAMGESFINPSQLPAGGQGSFKIEAQTDRPKGIKHLRLLTNAQQER